MHQSRKRAEGEGDLTGRTHLDALNVINVSPASRDPPPRRGACQPAPVDEQQQLACSRILLPRQPHAAEAGEKGRQMLARQHLLIGLARPAENDFVLLVGPVAFG